MSNAINPNQINVYNEKRKAKDVHVNGGLKRLEKHVVCPRCNIPIRAANLEKHLAKHETNLSMMPKPPKPAKFPKKFKTPGIETKSNAVKSSSVLRDNAGKGVSGWADKLNRTGEELRALYEGKALPKKVPKIKAVQNISCLICKAALKSTNLDKHYKKVHGVDNPLQEVKSPEPLEVVNDNFFSRWFCRFSEKGYSDELVQSFKFEAKERGFSSSYISDFIYVVNPIDNPLQISLEPFNNTREEITLPNTGELTPEPSYVSVKGVKNEEVEEHFFERWLRLFGEKGYNVATVQAFRRDAESNSISKSEMGNFLEVVKPIKHKLQPQELTVSDKKFSTSGEPTPAPHLTGFKGLKKNIHTIGRDSQEQAAFRKAVSANYDHRCAITGDVVAVEACHIQTHTDHYDNSLDNGVLLSVGLHRLFDAGIMIICSETMTISFTCDCFYKKHLDGALVKQGRVPISKKKLSEKNSKIKMA
ncbi:hypothetical protein GYD59_001950 [Salmonella enterica]|nr:hypothetical protein [Salmonella enterica]EEH2567249.1 hypothetical protein [Salmonella enterica]